MSRLARPFALALYFALAGTALHLLTNGGYGYFRDELYFLDAGNHLNWGYVDFPPLIAVIARFSRMVFGDSLHGVRFLPALAAGAKILLTGMLAREFGGGRFAVALACLAALAAPVYLAIDTLLTMNAFEPLFWTGCAYILLLALKRNRPSLLFWFGVLAGLGLQNKHSMLFFGAALAGGLLLTRERRLFATRWLWVAGGLALLVFLPNLIWQWRNGFPTLVDLALVRATHKNVELAALPFLKQQLMVMLPVSALVWLAGVWRLLFDRESAPYRAFGWAFVILFAVMMALKAKDYYLAPAYPLAFAAGGVAWEVWTRRRRLRWARVALPGAIVAMGAVAAPSVLPVLPPEQLVRYQKWSGIAPSKSEVEHAGPLPQVFGDMFGWPEMVTNVAHVYWALPPEERAKAAVLAGNYGEAGAVNFFGPRYGLPPAISGHQNYYFWGPRGNSGQVLILLQWSRPRAERVCQSVEDAAAISHPWSMAEEHYTILVCRGLRRPLAEMWPSLRHWN